MLQTSEGFLVLQSFSFTSNGKFLSILLQRTSVLLLYSSKFLSLFVFFLSFLVGRFLQTGFYLSREVCLFHILLLSTGINHQNALASVTLVEV